MDSQICLRKHLPAAGDKVDMKFAMKPKYKNKELQDAKTLCRAEGNS